MAKWRPIEASISLSEGLRSACHHDALFYTWGILHADAHGVMRRAGAKAIVFPWRSTELRVERAIDWLIEHGKLCQHDHRGHAYIHWCWWDLHQGEVIRKGRGAPLFDFFCPNENRAIQRDTAQDRGIQDIDIDKTVHRQDRRRLVVPSVLVKRNSDRQDKSTVNSAGNEISGGDEEKATRRQETPNESQ